MPQCRLLLNGECCMIEDYWENEYAVFFNHKAHKGKHKGHKGRLNCATNPCGPRASYSAPCG